MVGLWGVAVVCAESVRQRIFGYNWFECLEDDFRLKRGVIEFVRDTPVGNGSIEPSGRVSARCRESVKPVPIDVHIDILVLLAAGDGSQKG